MATNSYTAHSDIDLGLASPLDRELFEENLRKIKEALEESHIPYKIDIINLNLAKDDFKQIALKDKIIWHPKKIF